MSQRRVIASSFASSLNYPKFILKRVCLQANLKVFLGVDHRTTSFLGKTSYLNSIRYWV